MTCDTMDIYDPNELQNVKLNKEQLLFFREWLDKMMEEEKQNSLESIIKYAKKFKKIAKKLYPKKEFECWIDEETRHFHFEVKDKDPYWSRVVTAQVILDVRKVIDEEEKEDKIQRRLYV